MEEKGIKNTKEVLKLGFALGNVVKQSLADGKIGAEDLGLLMGLIPHLSPAFEDISEVIAEIKDIDTEEAKEILTFSAAELGGMFTSEELVEKINASLEVGLAIAKLVKVLQ